MQLVHSKKSQVKRLTEFILSTFVAVGYFAAALTLDTFAQNVQLVLGNPTGATSDERKHTNFLVVHEGYVLSYNRLRGTPNWVAWHLSASDLGMIDRPGNFRGDPNLNPSWRILHDDYTNSGYDRGHMTPSKDRSSGEEANRETFLMSNVQPQFGELNGGPWKTLEAYVQNQVESGEREAYQIAGCTGRRSRISEKVTVPTRCWKIVVLLAEGDKDRQRIGCSTRVIAIDMPNTRTVASDWRDYLTTVTKLEQKTGFDFFSALSRPKQTCLENKKDAGN